MAEETTGMMPPLSAGVLLVEGCHKGSALGMRDLLQDAGWRVRLVDGKSFEGLDIVVVPGGEPLAMMRSLKPGGDRRLRSMVARGGGYVGVCAGAAMATRRKRMLGLAPGVGCRNDNVWSSAGLARPDTALALDDGRRVKAQYANGPLMIVDERSSARVVARFETDVAKEHRKRHDAESAAAPTGAWVCRSCCFANNAKLKRCFFCESPPSLLLPPDGEMPGTAAVVAGATSGHRGAPAGRFALFSVHPELSIDPQARALFLDLAQWTAQQQLLLSSSAAQKKHDKKNRHHRSSSSSR